MKLPKVVIIGHPNVGKSTLFNRICGRKIAITSKIPGTTRDILTCEVTWKRKSFQLIDTGGLIPKRKKEILQKEILQQIKKVLKEADLILFLTEIKGILDIDLKIAEFIKSCKKPCLLVVNKVDKKELESEAYEFLKFGFGDPILISAISGKGIRELLDQIIAFGKKKEEEETGLKVAIIGRPNVGKSSLVNKLIKEERMIVSELPGTTRDAVDIKAEINGETFIFIDTAGLRRKKKIIEILEKLSVKKAIQAIKRADLVLFLIEAPSGIFRQDIRILRLIINEGKKVILVVNKWDLIKDISEQAFKEYLYKKLTFWKWVPIIFVSSKTGKGLKELIGKIKEIKQPLKKIRKRELNALFAGFKKGKAKIYSVEEIKKDPPLFIFWVSDPSYFKKSLLLFLERKLREVYPLEGIPVKFVLRKKKEK